MDAGPDRTDLQPAVRLAVEGLLILPIIQIEDRVRRIDTVGHQQARAKERRRFEFDVAQIDVLVTLDLDRQPACARTGALTNGQLEVGAFLEADEGEAAFRIGLDPDR